MKTVHAYDVDDMHTAGEPVRILVADDLMSQTSVLELRRSLRDEYDHIRQVLMLEPRGHADMYGAIVLEHPEEPADLGVVFVHNSGYSTMCGHATIALGRWLYERDPNKGNENYSKSYRIQCPCGPVDVYIDVAPAEDLVSTSFDSVYCFAEALDEKTCVPGLGEISYDLGYGGAYYAILPSSMLGMDFQTTPIEVLQNAAETITNHLRKTRPIQHPSVDDLSFLYGTILTDEGSVGKSLKHSANLCVFAQGQIDRSPTGSGVCARLAVDYAKGVVALNQSVSFSGLSGEAFSGMIVSAETAGVKVRVSGKAFYSGRARLMVEEGDSLGDGFTVPRIMNDVSDSAV